MQGLNTRTPSPGSVGRKMCLRGGGPVMGVEVTTTRPGDGKNYPSKVDDGLTLVEHVCVCTCVCTVQVHHAGMRAANLRSV